MNLKLKKRMRILFFCLLFSNPLLCSGGLEFDGVDDYVNVGSDDTLDLPSFSSMTISSWAKLSTKGQDRAICGKASAYILWWDFGEDYWEFYMVDSESAGQYAKYDQSNPNLDQWYHVVGVWNGSSLLIYVDGILGGVTDTISTTVETEVNANLYIGERSGSFGRAFAGFLNEIAIWNTALSIAEIGILHNSKVKGMPLQIKPANLVGYWPMDDGPFGGPADGIRCFDKSDTGNHGKGVEGAGSAGLTFAGEDILTYPE